jgi:hypothetical protein
MDPGDGGRSDREKVWHPPAWNSVDRLLAQLGMTPQMPLYRTIERDETLVNKC